MICIRGKRFWGKIDKNKWTGISIPVADDNLEKWQHDGDKWLNNNLSGYWYFDVDTCRTLYFEKKEDAIAFRLTWK